MDPLSKKELLEEIQQEDRIRRGEHPDSTMIQVLQRIARALEAIEKSLPLGPIQKQRRYY